MKIVVLVRLVYQFIIRSSSSEREPIDFTKQLAVDLETKEKKKRLVPMIKRIKLSREEMKRGWILDKARVKDENASDSSPDDSEPEGVVIKPEPVASSDESDIEAKLSRKKRIAKIEDSEVSKIKESYYPYDLVRRGSDHPTRMCSPVLLSDWPV